MTLIKWVFLLSILAVGLTDDQLDHPGVHLQIDNEKLTESLNNDSELRSILEKLRTGDKLVTAEVNDFADKLLENINGLIANSGLEPFDMPGFDKTFKLGLIKGWVRLEDGKLHGISTLVRQGDIKVSYEFPDLTIHLSMGISRLTFDYHYEAKLLGLGPAGKMEGKSKGSKITLDLTLNLTNLRIKMNKFVLNTIGKISVKFRGSITGQIINILSTVVIPLLKPILEVIIERIFKSDLGMMIDMINGIICQILGDCTEQPLAAML